MTKTTIHLGLTDKNGKIFDAESVINQVTAILPTFEVEGATVYMVSGLWKAKREQSLVIELWDVKPWRIKTIAKHLKRMYNQESIGVISQEASLTLV